MSHGDEGGVRRTRMPEAERIRLEDLLREKYPDFGATLAAEKLAALDGLRVSRETIRPTQIRLGLHRPKARRAARVFQSRARRPRFGELIQIDGSPHAWFEGRGPRCTLIVFIDLTSENIDSIPQRRPSSRTLTFDGKVLIAMIQGSATETKGLLIRKSSPLRSFYQVGRPTHLG